MSTAWTHTLKPEKTQDIIGHTKAAKEIKEWLRHLRKTPSDDHKRPPPVLFLYGPNGIGKSTLVKVLLKQSLYHIYELNAGEIRSKKRITSIMEKFFNSHSVDIMRKKTKIKGTAIIMDEVDGMSCGDKGGLHQLFHMVQEHHAETHDGEGGPGMHIPIVCISNKPYEKKLAPDIYVEVPLRAPSLQEIACGLRSICAQHDVDVEDGVIEQCTAFNGNDVRKNILFLQELAAFSNSHITTALYDAFVCITQKITTHLNLFEITYNVLNRPIQPTDNYFYYQTDPNLIPLMVYENTCPQMNHKKMNIQQYLLEYEHAMYNLNLLNRLKQTQPPVDAESIGSATATNSSITSDISFAHSAICCGDINSCLSSYPVRKRGGAPDIIFTSSLTKSATNSSSQNFFASICYKLGINSTYFYYVIPLIMTEIVTTPEIVATQAYSNITYSDIEKIVQIYHKYHRSNQDSLVVGTKCRRIWKKLKG